MPAGSIAAAITFVTFGLMLAGAASESSFAMIEAEEMDGNWPRGMAFGASGTGRASNGTALSKSVSLSAGEYTVYIRAVNSLTQQATYRIRIGGSEIVTPPQGPPRSRNLRIGWIRAGRLRLPGGSLTVRVEDTADDGTEVLDALALASDAFSDRAGRALAFHDHLLQQVEQASASPRASNTPADARRRQASMRKYLLGAMGLDPMPPRTPLNPIHTGTLDRGDYVIEKIAFESRPKHVVPALLYRPKMIAVRLPAVIGVIGHWNSGKSSTFPQLRAIALARRGYIALNFDPSYAWERRIPGNSESSDPFLSGASIQGHMAWDTMRAVDYLLTRPDVDAGKIALSGASGGGQQTLYAGAVDERIKVVAPAVYVWAFKDITSHWGYSFDNWLPGVLRNGDMGATLALIAPRALLVLAVDQDYADIEGSRRQVEQARPFFKALGADDRIKFSVHPGEHSYDKPLREALYGFLDRWLKNVGDGSPQPEPEVDPLPENSPALFVFTEGKIPVEGASTVHGIWMEEAVRFRGALPSSNPRLPGILQKDTLRLPKSGNVQVRESGGGLLLTTEAGLEIPAILKGSGARGVVWITERDLLKEAETEEVRALAQRFTVLVVEPRCIAMPADRLLGNQAAILLGRPLVGMWTHDILEAVSYLRRRAGIQSVSVAGSGVYPGLVALFSAILDRKIHRVAIDGLFASFLTVLGRDPIAEIPGMLRIADIDQLVTAAGADRVTMNRLKQAPIEVKVKGTDLPLKEFLHQALP